MQNSGLSNALNPLISIAHEKVYSIPLILIIGWRGSPRVNDEPQHKVKGKITESILKLLNIKYTIIRSGVDLKKFDKKKKKKKKNNSMLGLILVAFVILVFSITVAKMMGGATMEAYDHVRRPQLEQIN
jgi:phosphonopyruvate decarboxylase